MNMPQRMNIGDLPSGHAEPARGGLRSDRSDDTDEVDRDRPGSLSGPTPRASPTRCAKDRATDPRSRRPSERAMDLRRAPAILGARPGSSLRYGSSESARD